jgi:hypothetical protein
MRGDVTYEKNVIYACANRAPRSSIRDVMYGPAYPGPRGAQRLDSFLEEMSPGSLRRLAPLAGARPAHEFGATSPM